MINPVTQSFVKSTTTKVGQNGKETKTNEVQKVEDERVSKIAKEVEKGEYKLDTKATAEAVTDSLL